MQGPVVFCRLEGILEWFDEATIKGHDNFSKLAADLADIDLSGGEYLAPFDSAIDAHLAGGGEITTNILKYHIIIGEKTLDHLNEDQETIQGGTIISYRKFHKNWIDFAVVGLKSKDPSKSSNWSADVKVDNCIIPIDKDVYFNQIDVGACKVKSDTIQGIGNHV